MIRRTIFAITALAALAMAVGAWAADDSFFFVLDDRAGAIESYQWLDPVPESLAGDVELTVARGESGVDLARLSTPGRRFLVFTSRSCPPLIEITSREGGALEVVAFDPRVDWRCGGYSQTYVLELRLRDGADFERLSVHDHQTSPSVERDQED